VFLSYADAAAFVRRLGLRRKDEWVAWAASGERPHDIPSNPSSVYRKYWVGWHDWLGPSHVERFRGWRPFVDARGWARALGLGRQSDWKAFCSSGNLPPDIPKHPVDVYGAQWIGWGDWLGTGRPRRSK
jgi:hypothetical protein